MRIKRDFPEEEQELVFSGKLFRLLREHGVKKGFGKMLDGAAED